MTFTITTVIANYRERCVRHLQGATSESAEHLAYHLILQAFDQNQTGEPAERSLWIAQALAFQANSIEALASAPAEVHARTAKAREIVTQWAENFKHDTGHTLVSFTFR